jgi:hypothetical protein
VFRSTSTLADPNPNLNQGFSQDFDTISHFCVSDFFFIIMNKQEYELNLIISYFALLISNGDWKAMKNLLGWEHTLQISNQLIKHNIATILI